MNAALAAAPYSVEGTNAISQSHFTAEITATGPAPKVTSVTIEEDHDTYPTGKVIVNFAPADLIPRPGEESFRFDVICQAKDAQGQLLHLMDGDDRLDSRAKIDAVYDLRGEAGPARWKDATDVRIEVVLDYEVE